MSQRRVALILLLVIVTGTAYLIVHDGVSWLTAWAVAASIWAGAMYQRGYPKQRQP
jgi:hypothetical protein